MSYDYWTLKKLVRELRQQLEGDSVSQVSASSECLEIGFARARTSCLRFNVAGSLFLCEKITRGQASRHAHHWKYLLKAKIVTLASDHSDRVLSVRLRRVDRNGVATHGRLIFELLPRRSQVVLISEESGLVLGKWPDQRNSRRMQRVVEGKAYEPPTQLRRLLPTEATETEFVDRIQREVGDIRFAVTRTVALIDGNSTRECLFRAGIDSSARIPAIDDGQLRQLWLVLFAAFNEDGHEGFYWFENDQWRFSGLKNSRLPDGMLHAEPTMSGAIRACELKTPSPAHHLPLHIALKKQLEARLRRRERTLVALQKDLYEAADAERLNRMGHSLMAQLNAVIPGQSEIVVQDIFDESGIEIAIPLDPSLSSVANATSYLKRAAKFTKRREILPNRMQHLEADIKKIKEQLVKVEKQPQSKEVMTLALEYHGDGQTKNRAKKDTAYPRRYRTSLGWSVWAGRNNRENDTLTHKLAAQNDLWFHASGYSGSHVILRSEGRKEGPNRQTIEEAAGIAAYWSKGRTAKKVPVVYTQVKHVTRPKGASPGLAHLRLEKTLIVEPALLPSDGDSR